MNVLQGFSCLLKRSVLFQPRNIELHGILLEHFRGVTSRSKHVKLDMLLYVLSLLRTRGNIRTFILTSSWRGA
jgi:hypothetical protein